MGEKQQACLVALGVPVDSLHRSMFMSGYSYDSRICQALLSYYNILYYTYAHEAGEQGILLLLLTMLLYIVAFYLSLALVCSLSRSLFFFLGSFPQHSRCRATRQKRQGQGSFSLQPLQSLQGINCSNSVRTSGWSGLCQRRTPWPATAGLCHLAPCCGVCICGIQAMLLAARLHARGAAEF